MATFSSRGNLNLIRASVLLIIGIAFIFLLSSSYIDDKPKYDPNTLVFPSFRHTLGIRKATRFHLFLFTQNKVQFKDPQGLAAVRLLSWEDTTKTSDDDELTVYGVNSGQDNIIYNTSMTSLGIYGLEAKSDQRLNKPRGIAANEKGEVYVADTGNHRVVKLFNPGHDLIFQKSMGQKGAGESQFNHPSGVALDWQGNLYVTDSENHRIQVLSPDLQFLRQWGEAGEAPGKLSFPDGIAVTDKKQKWTYYRENFLVVIDLNHSRIQKFDPQGRYLNGILVSTFGYPECYLAYVALDYYDNIYVTDTKNHCIHKFDHHLRYLTSYGRYGDGDKEFIEPRGITIYRRFGQVFVAEKSGAQYFWIGTDCFNFTARTLPDRGLAQFSYFLTEPSFVTTDILDDENRFVTRLWTKQFKYSGNQTDYWSGHIQAVNDSVVIKEKLKLSPQYQNLKKIVPGKYAVKYKIEPTYSSYHYFEKILITTF